MKNNTTHKQFKEQMKIRNTVENLMSMIDDIKDEAERKQVIKYIKSLLSERA